MLPDGEEVGFRLSFHFGPNPHFSNATLTKTYFMEDMEELIPSKFLGTQIAWNPGMDTTVQVRQRHLCVQLAGLAYLRRHACRLARCTMNIVTIIFLVSFRPRSK